MASNPSARRAKPGLDTAASIIALTQEGAKAKKGRGANRALRLLFETAGVMQEVSNLCRNPWFRRRARPLAGFFFAFRPDPFSSGSDRAGVIPGASFQARARTEGDKLVATILAESREALPARSNVALFGAIGAKIEHGWLTEG
jgi:hypothetical protein